MPSLFLSVSASARFLRGMRARRLRQRPPKVVDTLWSWSLVCHGHVIAPILICHGGEFDLSGLIGRSCLLSHGDAAGE